MDLRTVYLDDARKEQDGIWVNLNTLPVGTEFYVINGDWAGRIIEKEGQKYVHVHFPQYDIEDRPANGAPDMHIRITKSMTRTEEELNSLKSRKALRKQREGDQR